MGAPLWFDFSLFLLPLPPVCFRLPLPPRAVPWAPLHEVHGKPALLRLQKRVRTPWFCRLFWSDVEKNTHRIRWRKSHSKVETTDEFDCAKQWKRSVSAVSYCIRKPGEGQTRKLSTQAEKYDITWKPVVCRDTSHERHRPFENAHSSSCSEWNVV